MRIYFAGIGGVGLGPLAQIARDAGHDVVGSDPNSGKMSQHLENRGVTISTQQDGSFVRQQHERQPLDWLVHTAAMSADHPEVVAARRLGIRVSKRDELLAKIIDEKGLKLIAIAGTHGKTSTTGMVIWLARYFGMSVSYSVGTTLSWGASGAYVPGSEYFVYECDEFDRNFLHFSPFVSIITTIEHDHADTYPTWQEYTDAFRQFATQSEHVVTWQEFREYLPSEHTRFIDETSPLITLPGEHNRQNASLVLAALEQFGVGAQYAAAGLNSFPGTDRRFEKLADNLYSDYGHTPSEIAATLQLASELSRDIVLVYQPHQNVRQHEIRQQYVDSVFKKAEHVYWLPTYLSREKADQPVLAPAELTQNLKTGNITHSELNDELWRSITEARKAGKLVLGMGAGDIDGWLRKQLRHELTN